MSAGIMHAYAEAAERCAGHARGVRGSARLQTGHEGFLASHWCRHSPHSMWPHGTTLWQKTMRSLQTVHSKSSCTLSSKLLGPAAAATASTAAFLGEERFTVTPAAAAAGCAAAGPLRLREPQLCMPEYCAQHARVDSRAPGKQHWLHMQLSFRLLSIGPHRARGDALCAAAGRLCNAVLVLVTLQSSTAWFRMTACIMARSISKKNLENMQGPSAS